MLSIEYFYLQKWIFFWYKSFLVNTKNKNVFKIEQNLIFSHLNITLKKQGRHFANKGLYRVKAMVFPVVMYGCESWTIHWRTLKNWGFQIVVLEKTLEIPLDCKDIKPVRPKGNQPWIFIGRTYAETEAQILWPPDVKSRLIGKDPESDRT